jgi:hypothetical protein
MLDSIARNNNNNNNNNNNRVLSLKDFAKSQPLSPQMVVTAMSTTDVIYKSNPNGLWLDFPTISAKAKVKPTEETRDDYDDHGASSSRLLDASSKQRQRLLQRHKEEQQRWSSRLVQQPQQRLLREQFHSGFIPSYPAAGDQGHACYAFAAPIPTVVTVGPMMDDGDDSCLFSLDDNDKKNENDDDSSFATAPDATFETFDDLSVLTGEENNGNDDDNKLVLAMQDTLLLEFLVDFCSKSSSSQD